MTKRFHHRNSCSLSSLCRQQNVTELLPDRETAAGCLLESIPPDELMQHRNYADILLTTEYINLVVAYLNIRTGDKKQAKELIQKSSSDRWRVRRTGLQVLTLLPKDVEEWVIQCYEKIPLYEYYLHKKYCGWK